MKIAISSILLLGLLLISTLTLFAQQESVTRDINLKVYLNGNWELTDHSIYAESSTVNPSYESESKNFDIGALSFAIEIDKNKKINQEFELMPIWFKQLDKTTTITDSTTNSQITSGEKVSAFTSTFRYQLNYYFLKEKKINPYIGLSSQLFYKHANRQPKGSNSFSTISQNMGLSFSIIPSLEFELTKSLSLDLNFPIDFYHIKINSETANNPAIEVDERTNTSIVGDFFPKKINFRIGINYKV